MSSSSSFFVVANLKWIKNQNFSILGLFQNLKKFLTVYYHLVNIISLRFKGVYFGLSKKQFPIFTFNLIMPSKSNNFDISVPSLFWKCKEGRTKLGVAGSSLVFLGDPGSTMGVIKSSWEYPRFLRIQIFWVLLRLNSDSEPCLAMLRDFKLSKP